MAAAHPCLANLPGSSWDTDSISATQGPRRENGNVGWAEGVGQLGHSNGVFICGTRTVGKESQRRKKPQPGLQSPLQQWQDGQGYWQGCCYFSIWAGVRLGQRQCDAGLCWKLNPQHSVPSWPSIPSVYRESNRCFLGTWTGSCGSPCVRLGTGCRFQPMALRTQRGFIYKRLPELEGKKRKGEWVGTLNS